MQAKRGVTETIVRIATIARIALTGADQDRARVRPPSVRVDPLVRTVPTPDRATTSEAGRAATAVGHRSGRSGRPPTARATVGRRPRPRPSRPRSATSPARPKEPEVPPRPSPARPGRERRRNGARPSRRSEPGEPGPRITSRSDAAEPSPLAADPAPTAIGEEASLRPRGVQLVLVLEPVEKVEVQTGEILRSRRLIIRLRL